MKTFLSENSHYRVTTLYVTKLFGEQKIKVSMNSQGLAEVNAFKSFLRSTTENSHGQKLHCHKTPEHLYVQKIKVTIPKGLAEVNASKITPRFHRSTDTPSMLV